MYILDNGRREIVIIPNLRTDNVVNSYIYVIPFAKSTSKCLSVAHSEKFLLLLQTMDKEQKIQLCSISFPKKAKCISDASFKIIKSVSCTNMKYLFHINESKVGTLDAEGFVSFYCFSSKRLSFQNKSDLTSEIKPCTNLHQEILTYAKGELKTCSTIIKGTYVTILDNSNSEPRKIDIRCFNACREVVRIFRLVQLNEYVVEEIGVTRFGFRFCQAVKYFYKAIGYVRPNGAQRVNTIFRSVYYYGDSVSNLAK